MPEKIEELVREAIAAAQKAGDLPEFEVGDLGFERPADPTNGDWSSTVAMRSAKLAHRAPRQIADAIVSRLPEDPSVERVEVVYKEADADSDIPPTIHPAEPAENGVFIAEVDLGYETVFAASVYDGLTAHNSLGAVAYDGDGNVVARTASEWEERYYENR